MKTYGKFASYFLFISLGAFVLFQYENCGNSSSTNNSSAVGPAGISYTVILTPQSTTPMHGVPDQMQIQVTTSGTESLIIKMGSLINGNRNMYCENPTGPTTNVTVYCSPTFNQQGPVQLYVEIDDPNFPINQPMLVCANPPPQGCLGTYSVNVQ